MLQAVVAAAAVSASSAAYLRDSQSRDLASIEGVVGGTESSATGGHVFAMKKIRTYEGPRLSVNSHPSAFPRPEKLCEKWAVLTSIFEPTETVRQLGSMSDWCVVVVGDKKGEPYIPHCQISPRSLRLHYVREDRRGVPSNFTHGTGKNLDNDVSLAGIQVPRSMTYQVLPTLLRLIKRHCPTGLEVCFPGITSAGKTSATCTPYIMGRR